MKKLIITVLTLFITFAVFSQRGEKMQERIKAQKVAFITERLDLSAAEAQNNSPPTASACHREPDCRGPRSPAQSM